MKSKAVSGVLIILILLFTITGRLFADDVTGTVIDNTTGSPLSNVVVKILETGDSTQTDITGTYFFAAVPNGSYTFLIGGGNYTPLISFRSVGSCCIGIRGNIDNDMNDGIDIADLVYFVDFMFNDGNAPLCTVEADVNADQSIDIADIVYMIDYIISSPTGPAPLPCL